MVSSVTVYQVLFESNIEIFEIIRKIETSGENIVNYLKGPVSHSGFKRLN